MHGFRLLQGRFARSLVVLLLNGLMAAAAHAQAAIDLSGVFHPGEPGQVAWRLIKPAEWNGTLVLDLDFAPGGYAEAQRSWFLQRGYAIGGIQRTQNETAYELKKYVDDLIAVRQNLIDAGADEPKRTIAFGASRGGFVSRMAVQYRPDIFKGAVAFAGGGSGVIAAWLGKADAVWALKTLVNPQSPLTINNLPDIPPGSTYGPTYEQDVALAQLVATARSTPQGMARLVLAAAFEQATDWSSGPTPPAPNDYETQGNLIASAFAFGNPQFVHKEIEAMAGGPVVWNHGIDYDKLLLRSGSLKRVLYWYAKAGLSLQEDLRTLRKAPRYSADPAAVQRVEQIGTFNGRTGGPVLSIKTVGDSADPVSLDEAYIRTFKAAGNSHNLRSAFIARAGHSSQTLRERLVAFDTLIQRLNTGVWPDTSPEAMNARALTIGAGATVPDAALGASAFTDYTLVPALRTWDFTHWGSYFSEYLQSLQLRHDGELEAHLEGFARHLQAGRTHKACGKLANFEVSVQRRAGFHLTRDQARDLLAKTDDLQNELACQPR